MKKSVIAIIGLFTFITARAQSGTTSGNGKVDVKETINVTAAYNQKASVSGTHLLATSGSGHKIYLERKTDSGPVIIVKDPKGNTVTTVGRRKVIQSEGRTICMECVTVNRPGGTQEECYEVTCNAIDKMGSGRTN